MGFVVCLWGGGRRVLVRREACGGRGGCISAARFLGQSGFGDDVRAEDRCSVEPRRVARYGKVGALVLTKDKIR